MSSRRSGRRGSRPLRRRSRRPRRPRARVRRPEPSALASWVRARVPQLPFLGPALRRLLEELPAPRDGLSGTERRMLRAIAAGAATPMAAFRAAQDLEAAPFLGDAWFF